MSKEEKKKKKWRVTGQSKSKPSIFSLKPESVGIPEGNKWYTEPGRRVYWTLPGGFIQRALTDREAGHWEFTRVWNPKTGTSWGTVTTPKGKGMWAENTDQTLEGKTYRETPALVEPWPLTEVALQGEFWGLKTPSTPTSPLLSDLFLGLPVG